MHKNVDSATKVKQENSKIKKTNDNRVEHEIEEENTGKEIR